MKYFPSKQSGFIALISAIIISLLVITITVSLSFTGFFSRFNVLQSEAKEQSNALAEACGDAAILKIAHTPSYSPTNETVPVGSDTCTIISVQDSTPTAGQKTIHAQAAVQSAVTNIRIVITTSTLTVLSWEEVPKF